MEDERNDFELTKFEELIDSWVCIDGNYKRGDAILSKIDVLERTLERLRVQKRCLDNNLRFEDYLQGKIYVDSRKLHYHSPESTIYLGCGTQPVNLQPMLLMFLLIYHKEDCQVYDVIEKFINKVWDQLDTLDFKRTKTGVVRCFTNTRFAAHTLRDLGLLKFTRREAYKTWVLSLSGFLVASVLLKQCGMDFKRLDYTSASNTFLHPDIQEACNNIRTYDMFVEVLASVCEPNTQVFFTFEKVLRQAYCLLQNYWKTIQDSNLSVRERKELGMQHIQRLEEMSDIDQFNSEFSKCINVERLISEL
jgi:hypothetical protein